jgi:hypothetical protein
MGKYQRMEWRFKFVSIFESKDIGRKTPSLPRRLGPRRQTAGLVGNLNLAWRFPGGCSGFWPKMADLETLCSDIALNEFIKRSNGSRQARGNELCNGIHYIFLHLS